jgi:large subunit GTPase 1
MRAGQGNPDEARAARYILKDYVNAKLLFCHSPPGQDEDAFNARTREILLQHAAKKKRAPVTRVGLKSDTFVLSADSANQQAQGGGPKGSAFDREFFEIQSNLASRPFIQGSAQDGMEFSRSRLYPHQNMMSDDGSAFTGRRARIAAVLTSAGANGLGGADKKHKKMKKVKQRSGRGYDD